VLPGQFSQQFSHVCETISLYIMQSISFLSILQSISFLVISKQNPYEKIAHGASMVIRNIDRLNTRSIYILFCSTVPRLLMVNTIVSHGQEKLAYNDFFVL
jgi:hypothetical protein